MVVLIVTKTTNYELHGASIEAKVAEGRVPKDALSRLLAAHQEHYETLGRLRQALDRHGIAFDEVSREFPRPWSKPYDLVLTVGGDGTLLAATHQMPDGGIIAGIRSSLTSVGYLCCTPPSGVDALVEGIVVGKLTAVDACRLKAFVRRIDLGQTHETEPILNDFLYTNANPAATTRYRLTFGSAVETHRSSGVWIATATGSTAAVYAAGGQRRSADERNFQFKVRELYRLGLTEPKLDGDLFDPDQTLLEIENRCQNAILALDGQHGVMDLVYGDSIRFVRAAPVKIVRKFQTSS